jgi:hypothetical protein
VKKAGRNAGGCKVAAQLQPPKNVAKERRAMWPVVYAEVFAVLATSGGQLKVR